MQIDALMADRHLACKLLGAPLNAQLDINLGPDLWINTASITAALGRLGRLGVGLFGAIPTLTTATAGFAAEGVAALAQKSGDLADGMLRV